MRHSYGYNGYDYDTKVNIITTCIFVVILILIMMFESCHDVSKWNNGHCPCGGNWVYQQAVGKMYDTDYIYKCDKCGDIQEFDRMMR